MTGDASTPDDDPGNSDDMMNGAIGEASTRFAAPTGARDTCGLKTDVSDTDAFSVDLVASAAAEVASG